MFSSIQKIVQKVINKDNILNIVVIAIVSYIFITNMLKRKLINIKTSDGQYHMVRDLPDKKAAAELMSEIKRRMTTLSKHMINKGNDVLNERFSNATIHETDLSESGTSYSINKGKELSICMRNKDTKKIHNINLLMFVCIHEMAHLMSNSYGHNDEFDGNFKKLLQEAVKLGLYSNEDYSKNNVEYCGMTVDHNPLF
jgi:predicted metal-dependent hydrolase